MKQLFMICPFCESQLIDGKCPKCSKKVVSFKISVACVEGTTKKHTLGTSLTVYNFPSFQFLFNKNTPHVSRITCPICQQDFKIFSKSARWLTKDEIDSQIEANRKGLFNKIFGGKTIKKKELDKSWIDDEKKGHYFIGSDFDGAAVYPLGLIYDENYNPIPAIIDTLTDHPIGLSHLPLGTSLEGAWYLTCEPDDLPDTQLCLLDFFA